MARVFIPVALRDITGGMTEVEVDGRNLRQIVTALDQQFPGIAARLSRDGMIFPGLAVSIDGSLAGGGLLTPVKPGSEIHFLPAIGGG